MRKSCDRFIKKATAADKIRFWANVTKTKSCWLVRPATKAGYGRFNFNGKPVFAHRCAKYWQSPPKSWRLHCCHLCRNKNCVRPSHLYWGTQKQNCFDKIKDGTNIHDHLRGSLNKHAKLTEQDVLSIYAVYGKGGVSLAQVGRQFGVNANTVCKIVRQKAWRHVTATLSPITLSRSQLGGAAALGSRSWNAKINENDVMQIRHRILQRMKYADVAKIYNVATAVVSHIAGGISWSHVPRLHGPMQRVTRNYGPRKPKIRKTNG